MDTILEILGALDLVDDFYEAVDSDDLVRVVSILKDAGIEDSTIREVLAEIDKN